MPFNSYPITSLLSGAENVWSNPPSRCIISCSSFCVLGACATEPLTAVDVGAGADVDVGAGVALGKVDLMVLLSYE